MAKLKLNIKNNADTILLIRLIVSSLLCIICLFLKFNNLTIFVLSLVAAIIGGYDILISAYHDIRDKNFISTNILSFIAVLILFIIGLYTEAAAAFLLYRIGLFIIEITKQKAVNSTIVLMSEAKNVTSEEMKEQAKLQFEDIIHAQEKRAQNLYEKSKKVSLILVIIAAVYIIISLILSNNTATNILHNASIMIFLASSTSVFIALPYNFIVGLGISETIGFSYKNYASFNKFNSLSTVVFEQEKILTSGDLHVSVIHSDVMDSETLLKMAAHILYKSDSPEAFAVRAAYSGEINQNIINNFREAPGIGAEIIINGTPLRIGTSELYESTPVVIPTVVESRTLFVSMAMRYLGYITFSESVLPSPKQLTADLNEKNIKSIIVSSSGNSECSSVAKAFGIKQYYSNCSEADMLGVVERSHAQKKGNVLFIHSTNFHQHSADIDASYNLKDTKYVDIELDNNGLFNIGREVDISKNTKLFNLVDIVFAIAVKLVLFILAMLGIGNLWFAVVIDALISIACILFSIHIGIDKHVNKRNAK